MQSPDLTSSALLLCSGSCTPQPSTPLPTCSSHGSLALTTPNLPVLGQPALLPPFKPRIASLLLPWTASTFFPRGDWGFGGVVVSHVPSPPTSMLTQLPAPWLHSPACPCSTGMETKPSCSATDREKPIQPGSSGGNSQTAPPRPCTATAARRPSTRQGGSGSKMRWELSSWTGSNASIRLNTRH